MISKLYIKYDFKDIISYYIFIHDEYFYLKHKLEKIIIKYLNSKINIFQNAIYLLDPFKYLYDNGMIEYYPDIINRNDLNYNELFNDDIENTSKNIIKHRYISIN
jgi:hypothetical protein